MRKIKEKKLPNYIAHGEDESAAEMRADAEAYLAGKLAGEKVGYLAGRLAGLAGTGRYDLHEDDRAILREASEYLKDLSEHRAARLFKVEEVLAGLDGIVTGMCGSVTPWSAVKKNDLGVWMYEALEIIREYIGVKRSDWPIPSLVLESRKSCETNG